MRQTSKNVTERTTNARRPQESIFGRTSQGLHTILVKSTIGFPKHLLHSWWDIRTTPRALLSCWVVLERIIELYQPRGREGVDNTCCVSSAKIERHGSASEFVHGLSMLATSKHGCTGRVATRQPAPCFSSISLLFATDLEILARIDTANEFIWKSLQQATTKNKPHANLHSIVAGAGNRRAPA